MKTEHNIPKFMGYNKSSAQKEIYRCNAYIKKRRRKTYNWYHNFTIGARKKGQTKHKARRRKEIIKIRVEMNKMEDRKTIENQQNQNVSLGTSTNWQSFNYTTERKLKLLKSEMKMRILLLTYRNKK